MRTPDALMNALAAAERAALEHVRYLRAMGVPLDAVCAPGVLGRVGAVSRILNATVDVLRAI